MAEPILADRLRENRFRMEQELDTCESFVEKKEEVARYLDGVLEYLKVGKAEKDISDELEFLQMLCDKLDLELNKSMVVDIGHDITYIEAVIKMLQVPGIKRLVNSNPNILNTNGLAFLREKIINTGESEFYESLAVTYRVLHMRQEELVRIKSELWESTELEVDELEESTELEVDEPEEGEATVESLNSKLISTQYQLDLSNYPVECLDELSCDAHRVVDACKNKLVYLKERREDLEAKAVRSGGVGPEDNNETEPKD